MSIPKAVKPTGVPLGLPNFDHGRLYPIGCRPSSGPRPRALRAHRTKFSWASPTNDDPVFPIGNAARDPAITLPRAPRSNQPLSLRKRQEVQEMLRRAGAARPSRGRVVRRRGLVPEGSERDVERGR
jgi:hypothetical protein